MIPVSASDSSPDRLGAKNRRACGDAESNLIFRLARPQHLSVRSEELAGITNWRRLLQLATDENALIALRHCLREAHGHVPADVERLVAVLALDREFRMRLLESRLAESLAALNAAGIDVLLLKGGALASTVYGSFAARAMRDIDILVRPEQAEQARAIMLRHRWAADPELPGDGSYREHHHLPPLRDLGPSGLRLEIHRSALPTGHPFRFTDEELWQAARPVRVGESAALVMHPTHHALHIAIHFAWSHMLKSGAWHAFRDLAALVAHGLVDWADFGRTARLWGAGSCCYWTLRLGAELSALQVPHTVQQRLKPRLPPAIRRSLFRHFANGLLRSDVACPSVRLDQALWSMAMQPRRNGHRDIRPWAVSRELIVAFTERQDPKAAGFAKSTLLQMGRSGRYLTEILA